MIDMTEETPSYAKDDEGIAFIDILIVIAKNKNKIIGSVLVVGVIAAGLSFVIPNKYTARIQVLPPQNQSSSSAIFDQLGALGGLAGSSLGLKNPTDMYVGIFNSRTISDKLINRFDLQRVYDQKKITDTRKELAKATNVVSDKNGIIVIDVTDNDPKRAADMANAYVEELLKLTKTLAVSQASQRRLFFQKQLENAKIDLSNAEVNLKMVQEKTGLIQLSDQAASIIKTVAALKAEIASKEVELGAMQAFATVNNPEYIRIQNIVAGLRMQLVKAETGLNAGNGDISVATNKVPEAGLEYVRRLRDVKYYETVFELLAKQFEIAKIEEAKDSSILQVLDSADIPDKKSGPPRLFLVLGGVLAALFFSICWAFIGEGLISDKYHEKKKLLNEYLKWGK